MADGKGTRWNLHQGIPKHFIKVNGETLLERTVRLLRQYDPSCQVIITSHDPRYEVDGALRYEPKNNVLEIDRFTAELIENDVCFLYGDTYYSEISAKTIVETDAEDLLFFGNGLLSRSRWPMRRSFHSTSIGCGNCFLQEGLTSASDGRCISPLQVCRSEKKR